MGTSVRREKSFDQTYLHCENLIMTKVQIFSFQSYTEMSVVLNDVKFLILWTERETEAREILTLMVPRGVTLIPFKPLYNRFGTARLQRPISCSYAEMLLTIKQYR